LLAKEFRKKPHNYIKKHPIIAISNWWQQNGNLLKLYKCSSKA